MVRRAPLLAFDAYLADPAPLKTFFEMTVADSGVVFLSGDSSDGFDIPFNERQQIRSVIKFSQLD